MANSYLNQDDNYLDNADGYGGSKPKAKTPGSPSSPTSPRAGALSIATPPDATSNISAATYNPKSLPTTAGDEALNNLYSPPASTGPQNANEYGQSVGNTIGSLVRGNARAVNSIAQPMVGMANSAEDFTRGVLGYGPADRSGAGVSLVSNANAAQPTSPAQRTTAPANPPPAYGGPMSSDPASEALNLMARVPGQPSGASAGDGGDDSDTALSVKGRRLGIGKMVDGVPTFSDGSIPGTQKTISDDQMQRLIASSAAPSNPYLGPEGAVGSAATGAGGLAGSLTDAQGVTLAALSRLPQNYDPITSAYDRVLADQDSAARDARSDAISIATRDPRSPLGIAARNADVDRRWNSMGSSRTRQLTAANAEAAALQRLNGIADLPTQLTAQAGRVFQQDIGSQQRGQAAAQENAASRMFAAQENARAREFDRRKPNYQIGGDGNLYRLNDISALPVTGADGKPFNAQGKVNSSEEKIYGDNYSKAFNALIGQGLPPEDAAQQATAAGQGALTGYQNWKSGKLVGPTMKGFMDAAKKQGSKMSDDQLKSAYQERYGNGT